MRNGNRPGGKVGRSKSAIEVPGILLSPMRVPAPRPDPYTPVQELRSEVLKSQRETRNLKRNLK